MSSSPSRTQTGEEPPAPPRSKRPPRRIQLSEEERDVLLQCRRNSVARGLPLGVGALLTLRWFVHQGRVPSHVTRWTGLYYTGAFLGAFYVGVASYKQTCMDKIMALEHSILKDQMQKAMAKLKGYGSSDDDDEKGQSPPPKQPHPPSPKRPRTHPTRSTPPPDVSLREGPSLNTGYEKDKRLLETQEQIAEQPDAFGGIQKQTEGALAKQESSPSKTRGRSYDEVRESARRNDREDTGGRKRGVEEEDWRQEKQQQQRRKVVRKNKYGDDVEE